MNSKSLTLPLIYSAVQESDLEWKPNPPSGVCTQSHWVSALSPVCVQRALVALAQASSSVSWRRSSRPLITARHPTRFAVTEVGVLRDWHGHCSCKRESFESCAQVEIVGSLSASFCRTSSCHWGLLCYGMVRKESEQGQVFLGSLYCLGLSPKRLFKDACNHFLNFGIHGSSWALHYVSEARALLFASRYPHVFYTVRLCFPPPSFCMINTFLYYLSLY